MTDGAVKKYYAFGGGTVAMRDGNGLQYFLTDHLGSVLAVTDSSGTLISEQRYLPFGEVRDDVGTITQTDFGYTFQRGLPGTGLMDYRARFYAPYITHFSQPDSIIPDFNNPQTLNRYSYALNNPIRYNDPSGHCIEIEDGLCVRRDPERNTYHIVHPGRERFKGDAEVAIADFILSGDSKSLNRILANTPIFIGAATEDACAGLGIDCGHYYQTVFAAMAIGVTLWGGVYPPTGTGPGSTVNSPVPSAVRSDLGDPDCPGCGYVNPTKTPKDILMSNGQPIGEQQGSDPEIRTLQSEQELMETFDALKVNAVPTNKPTYDGTGYSLPDGGFIGLRESADYGLTLDINIQGIPISRIHLPK